MKNYFLMFLAFAIFFSCGKKHDGFVLKGHIEGFEKGSLVAMPNSPGYTIPADTIQVIEGRFEYKGRYECPTLVWFLPVTDDPNAYNGSFNLFMGGNEEITIEGKFDDLKRRGDKDKLIVKGSPLHDEYLRLEDLFSPLKAGDTKAYVDAMLKETNVKTNQVMPYYLYTRTQKEDVEDRERYLSQLDKSLDSNLFISYLQDVLKNEKRLVKGSVAPNFTLKDINGKEYTLSDLKGKYVLFEFSASWCSWCKKEIPYLKQVYDYGKDKDFVMFTINLDKTRELWEGEVNKGEVEWLQLSDLQAMNGGVAKLYNITGIPQIFFIDKEGRIANNNLRGDDMINYIKETVK